MTKKHETSTKQLAVVGSISQCLQDHAENPFEGIFTVAFRDGGFSTYFGGLPTEPENAAECWLMVLEASKGLQKVADRYIGGGFEEPESPEKPHLTVINGGKSRRKPKKKNAEPSIGATPPLIPPKPKSTLHPSPGPQGKAILINTPSSPTPPATWTDSDAIATVVPGGPMPESLFGIPFAPWYDAPRAREGWSHVEGQNEEVFDEEPPGPISTNGKSMSAGVIVEEPDGRVWVVHPTNGFGGYRATFAKGRVTDPDMMMQAVAIKEAFEESGLKVRITGFLADVERTTTVTRYYRGVRIGGTPAAMGWESQAVSLIPRDQLTAVLNKSVDHTLVKLL